jgi:hypothetical protein
LKIEVPDRYSIYGVDTECLDTMGEVLLEPAFVSLNMNGKPIEVTRAELLQEVVRPYITNILEFISQAEVQGGHKKIFLSGTFGRDFTFFTEDLLKADFSEEEISIAALMTWLHIGVISQGVVHCGSRQNRKNSQIPYFLEDGKFAVKDGQVIGLKGSPPIESDVDFIVGIGKLTCQ